MHRRTVLKGLFGGAVASVALPPLEAMLGRNGDALADGSDLPSRFGVWFWGNGVRPEHWVPTTTGSSWTPNTETEPLRDLRPYVSVVSGCELKTATHPHHSGMTGIMTGQKYYELGTTRDTIVSTFARQSVDQDAADHFAGQAPFRSIEVGVTRFRGTDEGSTFQHLSHNGPNNTNPSEYDPVALYRRLFDLPTDVERDRVRGSVLDVVHGQAADLSRRLGTSDRLRLDQHMQSIRALEVRLEAGAGACALPEEPRAIPDVDGKEQIEEKNALMSELLALALACDLTRAFSVQFSTCGSGVIFWQVGATDSLHATSHNEAMPQPTIHAATTLTMSLLATFLRTLRDTPEGDGNLLDRCSILCTSELSDGHIHSNTDYPILVAGRGNGRLRGNVHYRSPNAENTSNAVLTALWGAGVGVGSWGVAEGRTTTPISALLV